MYGRLQWSGRERVCTLQTSSDFNSKVVHAHTFTAVEPFALPGI